jgi:hypothetical protein
VLTILSREVSSFLDYIIIDYLTNPPPPYSESGYRSESRHSSNNPPLIITVYFFLFICAIIAVTIVAAITVDTASIRSTQPKTIIVVTDNLSQTISFLISDTNYSLWLTQPNASVTAFPTTPEQEIV